MKDSIKKFAGRLLFSVSAAMVNFTIVIGATEGESVIAATFVGLVTLVYILIYAYGRDITDSLTNLNENLNTFVDEMEEFVDEMEEFDESVSKFDEIDLDEVDLDELTFDEEKFQEYLEKQEKSEEPE